MLDNGRGLCYYNRAPSETVLKDIAEWSSSVARRAHNPKVMWFKSHLRNQQNALPNKVRRFSFCNKNFK